jgi:catechol-2,3-dioxygenase
MLVANTTTSPFPNIVAIIAARTHRGWDRTAQETQRITRYAKSAAMLPLPHTSELRPDTSNISQVHLQTTFKKSF